MQVTVSGAPAFVHTGGVPFDGDLPAIVFVHGAGMDHSVWRYLARAFAHDGYAVLAVDLPGHGRSGGAALDTIGDMAGWVDEAVGVFGVDRAAVVGHSMGALIGLELAAGRPWVGHTVLVGASGRMAVHPDLQAAADAGDPLAADLIVGWSHTGADRFGSRSEPGLWMAGATRRLLCANLAPLGGDLRACAEYPGLERAATVKTPTLVVSGTDDRMTSPKAGAELAQAIEGARFETVSGAGHMLLTVQPRELRARIGGFLRTGQAQPGRQT